MATSGEVTYNLNLGNIVKQAFSYIRFVTYGEPLADEIRETLRQRFLRALAAPEERSGGTFRHR